MGLINSQMQEMPQAMPEQAPEQAPEETMPAGEEAVSPEEQRAYEGAVLAGLKLLHDDQTADSFVEILKQRANEPSEAMANTTVLVMNEVVSRGKVPPEVILPAAGEILSEVATIAEASKAFQPDPSMIEEAWQNVAGQLMKQNKVSPEDAQGFMKSVDVDGAKKAMNPEMENGPA